MENKHEPASQGRPADTATHEKFRTFTGKKRRTDPIVEIDPDLNTKKKRTHSINLLSTLLYGDAKQILALLKSTDPDVQKILIEQACKTSIIDGTLPLDKFRQTRLDILNQDPSRFEHIIELVLGLMQKIKVAPLENFISMDEIDKGLDSDISSDEHLIYEQACIILNETRATLHQSSSHPDGNQLTRDELISLNRKKVAVTRQLMSLYNNDMTHLYNYSEIILKYLADVRIGNCHEMAVYAFLLCYKYYPLTPVEFMSIENGDHTFIVLGTDLSKVVCDPWSGEIYPISEIQQRLHDFTRVSDRNVLTFFNPLRQSLKVECAAHQSANNYAQRIVDCS